MAVFRALRTRAMVIALAALVVVGGGIGTAVAATSGGGHRGYNEYGMTHAYYRGRSLDFTYTKGYYCDTSVHSYAWSKCEAGATFKRPPAKDFDPLYITVPLGFTEPMNMLDCPDNLICVDHPAKIDLTRLEPALKPLYPKLTKAQLYSALKNFTVPGHDHFITTTNGGVPEWWPVVIVGVTNQKLFNSIAAHKSYGFINYLIKHKNKNVVGPIPTNLFLYFAAR